MFFISWFCTTQKIHKLLIREAYEEYIYFVKKGIPLDTTEEMKQEWWDTLKIKEKTVICDLLAYCVNYPYEKISENRYVTEYDEYPQRLEENLEWVLQEL